MTYKNLLICFILCTTLLGCRETVAQDRAKVVSPKEMLKSIDSGSVQLIDIRTPAEFQEGHLKNAKNIDFLSSTFKKDISGLDKEKPVYIYCRSGNRSGKSVKDFLNAGFTEIYDLQVGIVGWKSEGLPVVFD
jgi:rhodanese-related sulfurtransferase